MSQAQVSASSQTVGKWKSEIIVFCCNFCAYAAADLAGARRMQYPSNVRVVHVPCTGKIALEHILAVIEMVETIEGLGPSPLKAHSASETIQA